MQDLLAIRTIRDGFNAMIPVFLHELPKGLAVRKTRSRHGLEAAIFDIMTQDNSVLWSAMDAHGLADSNFLRNSAKAAACEYVNRVADGIPESQAIRRCIRSGRHHLLTAIERHLSLDEGGTPNIARKLCMLVLELEHELGADFEFKCRFLARIMRNNNSCPDVLPTDVARITFWVHRHFRELDDLITIVERALSDTLLHIHKLASERFNGGKSWLPSRFIADDAKCEFRHQLMTKIEDRI